MSVAQELEKVVKLFWMSHRRCRLEIGRRSDGDGTLEYAEVHSDCERTEKFGEHCWEYSSLERNYSDSENVTSVQVYDQSNLRWRD